MWFVKKDNVPINQKTRRSQTCHKEIDSDISIASSEMPFPSAGNHLPNPKQLQRQRELHSECPGDVLELVQTRLQDLLALV